MAGKSFKATEADSSLELIAELACRGGWPSIVSNKPKLPYEVARNYLSSIVAQDTSVTLPAIREREKFRRLLVSLARNNATIVKNPTLQNDVQATEGGFSTATLASYLQLLRDLFILDEIPGWNPQLRSKARLLSYPKRMFCDPSLAAAALGATPDKLLGELPLFGMLFEGLCLRDLLVYAEAQGARVYHYRDNANLEVDAIVELPDGSWGGFEIKLGGQNSIGLGAKSLLRLQKKLSGTGLSTPHCLVVLTASNVAYHREDGVSVVPITALRD
jgi:predicted AAA+ superfamily ATPase